MNIVDYKISGLSKSTALFVESLMVAVFQHWESQHQKLQCQEVNSFKGDLLGAPDFIHSIQRRGTKAWHSVSLKNSGVSLLSQQNHIVLPSKLVLAYMEKILTFMLLV